MDSLLVVSRGMAPLRGSFLAGCPRALLGGPATKHLNGVYKQWAVPCLATAWTPKLPRVGTINMAPRTSGKHTSTRSPDSYGTKAEEVAANMHHDSSYIAI